MKKQKVTFILLAALMSISVVNVFIANDNSLNFDLLFSSIETLASNESGGNPPTCMAGGCHARSCSFSGQIEVLGNGATYTNSIECDDLTWACCFTTAYCFNKNRCS